MVRPTIAVLSIALAATAVACSGHRRPQGGGGGAEPDRFGVYRARFVESGHSARKAKVFLFASLPDRLHAEVVPPVGGPALIIDGGHGRLAVTVNSRDAAWVGDAREDVLETILGFPVTLEALVSALLTLNIYRPLRAPMAPAAVSSVLGWSVGEFALHHIALQLALMLAFAASGGLGEVAGKLGLVVLLSSWGALLTHYWNGRRAGEERRGHRLRGGAAADHR